MRAIILLIATLALAGCNTTNAAPAAPATLSQKQPVHEILAYPDDLWP
jgi:hypothetical protein